jgi:hypothetical protein
VHLRKFDLEKGRDFFTGQSERRAGHLWLGSI